jgi:hypothetical protein
MSNTDGNSVVAARMSGTDTDSVAVRSDGSTETQPSERATGETKSENSETSRSHNEKEGSGKLVRESANPANTGEDVLGADVYPGDGTLENPFVVDWDRDDPENPYNWSKRSRWLLTCQVCNEILDVQDIDRACSCSIRWH